MMTNQEDDLNNESDQLRHVAALRMADEAEKLAVLLEDEFGAIEFKGRISNSGSLRWGVGRHVLTGQPRVRLSADFARRLRQAVDQLHNDDYV